MQDRTIDNALLALRKQGGEQGRLAEALLELRDVDRIDLSRMKRTDRARRGEMRRIVLDALADGPKTLTQVAAYVAKQRPDADAERAYMRAAICLSKLKAKGLVGREERLWLTQNNTNMRKTVSRINSDCLI